VNIYYTVLYTDFYTAMSHAVISKLKEESPSLKFSPFAPSFVVLCITANFVLFLKFLHANQSLFLDSPGYIVITSPSDFNYLFVAEIGRMNEEEGKSKPLSRFMRGFIS